MLRWVALAALLVVSSGCLGSGPFQSCRSDSWPEWGVGEARVTVCEGRAAREAFLYVPLGTHEPVPLLLMLHGGGGNARQFQSSSNMDDVADELGFAVLYAEGTPARRVGDLRTWNAMACCGRAYEDGSDDVAFLGDLLDGALDRWPIDEARIGVAGHSNGAMMAYRLAAERSDVVASAMPVAGAIGGQEDEDAPLRVIPEPAQPVSILAIHARDDDHVPYEGGHGTAAVDGPRIDLSVAEAIAFWVEASGFTGSPESVERQDGVDETRHGPGDRNSWVVALATEGGHGWPGSRTGFNPAPDEPDASREIGLFLLAHPRVARTSAS